MSKWLTADICSRSRGTLVDTGPAHWALPRRHARTISEYPPRQNHTANEAECTSKQLLVSDTQPHQFETTMTRTEAEITRDEQIDLKVLVEYVKNDLFPKAKFVLGKDEWDVGGTIYKDYML